MPLRPREKARCVRCTSVLYRGTRVDLNRMAAIVTATLLTFLIAQFSPIVGVDFNGQHTSSTLFGAIEVLWSEQMQAVATVVFLFTTVYPAVELSALLYVTLALRGGFRPPGLNTLLRMVASARRWSMTEVLMLGILVTLIKLHGQAKITPQPGLFAFAALTVMLAVVVAFDPRRLWNIGDDVSIPPPPPLAYKPVAGAPAPLVCHACGIVAADAGIRRQSCGRCGKALHARRPDSIGRTWALLLAAAILYIPANLMPVLYTHALLGGQDDTIISGVVYFWRTGAIGLAVIIFTASILVPLLKLAVLSLLAWTAQNRSRWQPHQRTTLYRIVEFVGRWSMLDIFVITLTVALVRFKTLATITPGPGAMAFCAVVVLTMLASRAFDPRLIWDAEPAPAPAPAPAPHPHSPNQPQQSGEAHV